MTNVQDLANIFKILSVDTRLRIVQLLTGRSLCVGALAARLDVTQGAVSQHLRILRDAGLVKAEKRGYYVHYSLKYEVLSKLGNRVSKFLDTGTPNPCDKERKGDAKCVKDRKRVRSPRN
ncbi:ArsR/SmtB family transcription factor [Candidatus Hydrogenedentota bacterium]